ncbi:MAG: cysteine synthase family protein [Desulfocurvibacter africanus]
MVFDSIMDCVGRTPCLRMDVDGGCVFAKAEFMNPGGSIKDRITAHILKLAETEGRLRSGMRIAEATSGNTGISLAMAGAALGYRVTIFMPETASLERRKLLGLLGAELVLTPAAEGVGGAVAALKDMLERNKDIFVMDQFVNQENARAHYRGTGREIWEDMDGRVDCFVSGLGSGGTLMGVGAYLKEHNPDVRLIAVEPENASALLGQKVRAHRIEGIGDGFVPAIVQIDMISEIMEIADEEAMYRAVELARTRGVMAGISAGANLAAAATVLKKHPGWRVATILPDRAERYFSTAMFGGAA